MWLPLACPLLRTWPATQACALTGNRTGNPLVHRLTLNPLSQTSQGHLTPLHLPTAHFQTLPRTVSLWSAWTPRSSLARPCLHGTTAELCSTRCNHRQFRAASLTGRHTVLRKVTVLHFNSHHREICFIEWKRGSR